MISLKWDIRIKVYNKVWDEVYNKVWSKAYDAIKDKVRGLKGCRIYSKIRGYVWRA